MSDATTFRNCPKCGGNDDHTCGHQLSPDPIRVPTSADAMMAGELSGIWPMDIRHPSDAIHLAIFVNDRIAREIVLDVDDGYDDD